MQRNHLVSRQEEKQENDDETTEQEEEQQQHITIPEVIKKLIVPPGKRTDEDCKLLADALYVFISSIPAFKEGLLIRPRHNNMALCHLQFAPKPNAQDFF